jgi:5'-nucleotidase/UDP-sugar diphosphatase
LAGGANAPHINNLPIDAMQTYRMVVNNFQAAGGDGYPKLTSHPSFMDSGFVDADVLRAFVTVHRPLKAANFEQGDAVVRR